MDEFHADPMLRAIGGVGPGALTSHPRFGDLAQTGVHEHLRPLLEDVRPHGARRRAGPADRGDQHRAGRALSSPERTRGCGPSSRSPTRSCGDVRADLAQPARARALSRLPGDDARGRALGGAADGGGGDRALPRAAPDDELAAHLCRTSSTTRPRRPATTSGCWRTSRRSAATRRGAGAGPVAANVATLVGAQYYWLRHVHPVSLLGHMAVMEGYSPPARVRRPPAGADRLPAPTASAPSAATRSSTSSTSASSTRRSTRCR